LGSRSIKGRVALEAGAELVWLAVVDLLVDVVFAALEVAETMAELAAETLTELAAMTEPLEAAGAGAPRTALESRRAR